MSPAGSSSISQELCDFVHGLYFDGIPETVREHAKLRILEVVGLCYAGLTWEPAGRIVADQVIDEGGKAESTVIGYSQKVPAPRAALVNGVTSQSMQFCDIHLPRSGIHPSVCVVPAALAVGEALSVSGRDLIAGVVAGIEVIARIGDAAPSVFFDRGFYPTSLCGTFAAALVAGKLQGLAPAVLANALGIAGTITSGSMESVSDGSQAHQLNAGWAAQNGVVAARLAQRGFTGPSSVFEGQAGFFNAYAGRDKHDLSRVVRGLGETWETLNTVSKVYPVCALASGCMEASLEIKRRHRIDPDDVADICCYISSGAVPVICEPSGPKLDPPTHYAAKFSLPYLVALMVCKGTVDVEDFTQEKFRDRRVLVLARKVRYIAESDRAKTTGKVVMQLRDGTVLQEQVLDPRGTLKTAPTYNEIVAKFRANAGFVLSEEQAEKIVEEVSHLDELPAINSFVRGLGRSER